MWPLTISISRFHKYSDFHVAHFLYLDNKCGKCSGFPLFPTLCWMGEDLKPGPHRLCLEPDCAWMRLLDIFTWEGEWVKFPCGRWILVIQEMAALGFVTSPKYPLLLVKGASPLFTTLLLSVLGMCLLWVRESGSEETQSSCKRNC